MQKIKIIVTLELTTETEEVCSFAASDIQLLCGEARAHGHVVSVEIVDDSL